MKPRLSLVTLGVDDLERAVRFYRDGLGLATQGIQGNDDNEGGIAFFDLQRGVKLALWGRRNLAKDAGVSVGPPSPGAFALAHNVVSRAAADEVMAQAQKAGAKILKPAADTFWGGYSGYFQDPDGHVWEVAWNPHWPLED